MPRSDLTGSVKRSGSRLRERTLTFLSNVRAANWCVSVALNRLCRVALCCGMLQLQWFHPAHCGDALKWLPEFALEDDLSDAPICCRSCSTDIQTLFTDATLRIAAGGGWTCGRCGQLLLEPLDQCARCDPRPT